MRIDTALQRAACSVHDVSAPFVLVEAQSGHLCGYAPRCSPVKSLEHHDVSFISAAEKQAKIQQLESQIQGKEQAIGQLQGKLEENRAQERADVAQSKTDREAVGYEPVLNENQEMSADAYKEDQDQLQEDSNQKIALSNQLKAASEEKRDLERQLARIMAVGTDDGCPPRDRPRMTSVEMDPPPLFQPGPFCGGGLCMPNAKQGMQLDMVTTEETVKAAKKVVKEAEGPLIEVQPQDSVEDREDEVVKESMTPLMLTLPAAPRGGHGTCMTATKRFLVPGFGTHLRLRLMGTLFL